MPKVEQYDWSKLKPQSPNTKQTHGTKDFNTYEFVEAHKNSRNGAIKVTKLPTNRPSPFVCSKCRTDCETKNNLNEHWSIEH
jgi:hypothetical protein